MHILLIHQAFVTLSEAGGTRHYELAQYLVRHGHRVTIIASPISYLTGQPTGHQPVEEPEPGMVIQRVYAYPALHRSFYHRLISFFSFMLSSFIQGLKTKDIDIVWGTSPPILQGFTAWLVARLKGKHFVFEVRDLWPSFAIAIGVLKNPILIRLSLWLERFLYSNADRIMVNSPGFVDHITATGAHDIVVIPNSVDVSMFNPDSTGQNFRKEHQLEGKYVILYAGAHGISNDLDVVLEAANLLRQQTAITFVLVGDGKEKQNLITQAASLGLENVIFLPPIAKDQMLDALAAADACVTILKPLDLYKTTYPNKVFDYMAAGRPVLCVIDGVIRQVVESGKAGVFIPPGNPQALASAIINLFQSPEESRLMGKNGRMYVEEHFDRTIQAKKLLSFFESLG
jgi:glycosyltransferase involved in cell wall biosynthesis